MAKTLACYVDDRTFEALEAASRELQRPVEELAGAAIAEAALRYQPAPELRAIDREAAHG